ncbi:MAG: hypothetical protein EOO88_27180 [Pedobacter sp.]|nr:MAG: hypothetical protein EOO88_27180 [Pedobacter sp.]
MLDPKTKHLYESLFVLAKCSKAIASCWELLNTNPSFTNHRPELGVILFNNISLESAIYFEEFDNHTKKIKPPYSEGLEQIKEIVLPIRQKINKWTGLKKFRNHFIAHPWRDKYKDFEFKVPDYLEYQVPRNYLEVYLLVIYMEYINSLVCAEFRDCIEPMNKYMWSIVPASPPANEYSTLNAEQLTMVTEVNEKCKALGKMYRLNVYLFDEPLGG